MDLSQVRVVLVHTSHPGNIGGVARAMKNMGMTDLCLVAPKEYPSDRAIWRAASAKDVLDGATVVETVDEAIADCHWVVGTSARERRIPWPLVNPRQFAERAATETRAGKIAILFGREDRGLTNDELQRCNQHVHIPTNPDYSSLNLAAAVQVLCYELRMASEFPADQAVNANPIPGEMDDWDVEFASSKDVERMLEHLEQTLVDLEFHDPANPRQLMTRLRRLFTRAHMDEIEVKIWRGILKSVQKVVGTR